ncbi:SMI1/KNR4 family protein [Streptomyces sp. NPDC050121]|uniref:SMI1/KNR4 family protein n=1 Tax=Streptomyces sp. NPDC050121 TaxID=3365601 RepID=UPI0037B03E57
MLEEISGVQGVRLDPEYAEFLGCMGAGSGRTLTSEVIFYPAVLSLRSNAKSMCAEFDIVCDLAEALVVASHQGYIYYYVALGEGAVYCIHEDSQFPIRMADSFSEFLYEYVKSS